MSPRDSSKTVYIEHLGCAKNQVDLEVMGARLQEAGWTWLDDPADAGLILVNTCGFIEPAQEESIDTTLALLAAHPGVPVAMTGCLAQRFSAELSEGMPELAGIFGNREPDRIAEFVDRLSGGDCVVWLPEGREEPTDAPRSRLLSHPASAYVKIAEGCDHHCSFCAIPAIRGTLRVRSRTSVLKEFRELRQRGIHEFNLVAQDLAAWRDNSDGEGFLSLVDTLLAEPGEFWLRPLYLYPDQFPLELVRRSVQDPRLLPYFDLSFQHGSPEILRRMGRPGTPEGYLELIAGIREINPDASLRSSFIVGFPGETAEHLQQLTDFLAAATLEWVGVFEFSPQTGTGAAAIRKGVVPDSEKTRRRLLVESIQEPIVTARLTRHVGSHLPVLIEERIQESDILLGRSPLQAPEVDGLVVVHHGGDAQPGHLIQVEITGVTGVDMQGRRIIF